MVVSTFRALFVSAVVGALSMGVASVQAHGATPTRALLEMKPGAEKRLKPSSEQVSVAGSGDSGAPGVVVTISPGKEGYPGVSLRPPESAAWNLSRFGHVTARVVNLGAKPLTLALRLDNAGNWSDNPTNTEMVTLSPSRKGTATTIFGFSYGGKPGFPLRSSAVVNLLLFAAKSDVVQRFRLESLVAGGPAGETPPIAPDAVRTKPVGGDLLSPTAKITAESSTTTIGSFSGAVRLVCQPSGGDLAAAFRPAMGRWDLRDYLEVRVRVRNNGGTPIRPRVRLATNGGTSDWVEGLPLAPGAVRVIRVPFAGTTVADLSKPGTGSQVTSDAVSAVLIGAANAPGKSALGVESIRAFVPPASFLPEWLGKRPPVGGEWVKTFDDEFNGSALDSKRWSIYGDNYWDTLSHWSKKNVLLGGGTVRLRYEKRTGPNNDDPTQKLSEYASGYLHTYNHWVQRYGYFEARVKLPTAPGLWPAFWMMPDRANRADPQGKRQDTANGGMEFDILEHLTRWGPYRYNIAMHYDGYGKDHKFLGSDKIYVQPDAQGFITCGLLWTPGSTIYYANGREVLRWTNPSIATVPGILMFTLPTGGWDNSPLEDARLPADFIVDYARVWQRKDLASRADGFLDKSMAPNPGGVR